MRRKKNWKRWSALLLGLTMSMGMLAGCGGKETADGGQNNSPAENESAVVSTASVRTEAEGLPISDEKLTFTIAVPQVSALKTAAEKECVKKAEEETNIHIEWMEIPQSGWDEKVNILFSTDSLPDAIIGGIDVSKYYEQLAAWDDYMKDYAPNVSAFFDTRDDYPESLIAPDGKIHCMPIGDESLENTIDSQLWINADWLEKVGMDMPTTPEEFKEVLIAFRDQDPNGNGIQDEIPFTFFSAWNWGNGIENLFGPWGVLENSNHVFVQDGKVTFSPAQQGYYDTLFWLHELYQEGLIDKEVFTMSVDQYDSRGAAGDVIGAMINYNGTGCGVDNGDGTSGSDRYLPVPVLKGTDGTQMIGLNNAYPGDNFVITSACKNPEALVRWYDYINSSLENALLWGRGAEGVAWKIEEKDGQEVPVRLTLTADVLAANGGYSNLAEYRQAECFAGKTPALWRQEYDLALQFDELAQTPNWKRESIKEQMQYGVYGLPSGMSSDPENEERRVILKTDIDTYLEKFIADSVINGIDEDKWNTHLKTLESLKTDEYTQLCQEFVDDYESR